MCGNAYENNAIDAVFAIDHIVLKILEYVFITINDYYDDDDDDDDDHLTRFYDASIGRAINPSLTWRQLQRCVETARWTRQVYQDGSQDSEAVAKKFLFLHEQEKKNSKLFQWLREGDNTKATNSLESLHPAFRFAPSFTEDKDSGWSLLHWAVANGLVDIVRNSITKNADPSVKDHKGRDAMRLAIEYNQPQVVDFLQSLAIAEERDRKRPKVMTVE